MGKLADTVPGRPIPQNRNNSAPNALVNGAPLISLPNEPLAVRDHPTSSEASTHVSNNAPPTIQPATLISDVADLPPCAYPSNAEQGVEPLSRLVSIASQLSTGASLTEDTRRVDTQLAPQTGLKPKVKACTLSTGGLDMPVIPDTKLVLGVLNRVRNIDSDHIITRINRPIDTAFDNFFDPTDIGEGGVLILIVSCHGTQGHCGNVILQFVTQDGTTVDSKMLRGRIMALPAYCTLEVIVDTCCAEGVVPGLRRILTGAPSYIATYTPPSGPRFNAKATTLYSSSNVAPSTSFSDGRLLGSAFTSHLSAQAEPEYMYRAQVVVWAASTLPGKAYTEEDLPERPGAYSILIGAIFGYLGLNGPNINRRDMWEYVLKVVKQHNDARRERDLRKPLKEQAKLIKADRIQNPVLLTSVKNHEFVLSGLMFQPI